LAVLGKGDQRINLRACSRLAVRFFKAAGELLGRKSQKLRSMATSIFMCGGEPDTRMDLTKRYINFCHRYPLERMDPEPQGLGYSISAKFARHHEYGNNAN
jgi:hypothetical protein